MRTEPRILNFNLFGETGDLPDVVHCETIAARSRLHDGTFAPHRHARLHQVLLVEEGGGWATIDGARHRLGAMTLVNVPMGAVHGYRFDHGTNGLVVTLAAETVDAVLQASEGLRPVLARAAVWPAAEAPVRTIREIAEAFPGLGFARAQILRSLAGLLLGQIARELARRASAEKPAAPDLLDSFETMLEEHFADHWGVADYARALAVSPTHLTRVARTATGRPASRLITERLVREARRNLAYTNLAISTIAYELGFSDPAYFSRVFARATGMPPRVFRERTQAGGMNSE